jgi:oligopeptidase B
MVALFMLISCDNKVKIEGIEKMTLPKAEKHSFSYEVNSVKIEDEYAWLRDKNWPKVEDPAILNYLNQENDYFKAFFSPFDKQKEQIFEELKGRIKLDDQSTYVKKDNYYYYTRTEKDKEYTIFCRKLGSVEAKEQIVLDVNKLAEGKSFTSVGDVAISPDHKLLAYSVDFTGGEKFTIKIFNLENGQYLPDTIDNTIGSIVWHEDQSGFFYTPVNENWRHDKVMYHYLGKPASDDTLVMHEKDPLYQIDVSKSGSKRYIFIGVGGHDSNETYVINMHDKGFTPKLLRAKQSKVFYGAEDRGDYFYIHTNDKATNFRIARVSINNFENNEWQDYIGENSQYLSSCDISQNYLILNYRDNGLPVIKIKHFDSEQEKQIKFPDAAFTASGGQANYEEDDLRISYASLGRPATSYSYDFKADKLSILKTQEIPSGFNPDEYTVERIFAKSKDGVTVPISLFYKKSLFKKDGSNPLYLYGYGSYGISTPPSFRSTAVSLVNRGFVFAIAHIRGGDDLGHDWYEAAKFLTKKRTFEDFLASAEHLIEEKYTSKGNIAICGGSAGGLLIGYVLNEKPELFKAAIAHVPFVDVLNTMLDENLPLTPGEFKEWGNPKEADYFKYMLSYSPYDNIKAQAYPAIMVTAGLSDPRVGYWEAAKWVARLRDRKIDKNLIIFKTNMDFGHQGASGRFDYLKEVAEDIVFILNIFGKDLTK